MGTTLTPGTQVKACDCTTPWAADGTPLETPFYKGSTATVVTAISEPPEADRVLIEGGTPDGKRVRAWIPRVDLALASEQPG